jgi:hypothetical protein
VSEHTIKCPICEKPYKVYSHFAGDQSACSKCQQEARGGSLRDRLTDRTNR